ncbi:unnamed protein product [Phytophthora lilii]|uniref:Unnamed protein product n=1 Tax=Phytophthora lilii TaxID=2077276 RepID=A0A9W6UAB5_9STRA|nr:unnamed protein product [Phytophthora lilii]
MLRRGLWLFLLCILLHGKFALHAGETEVALEVDGSVVDENRPVVSVAGDRETNGEDDRVQQSAPMQKATSEDAETMEMGNAGGMQQETDVATVMTTLQQELAEVEQMVKLQEKKLQVLEKMRLQWMENNEERDEEQDEVVKKRKGRIDVEERINRKLDAAIAETVAESAANNFDTYFVEKVSIQLEGEVADMKMIKMHTTSAMELIAIAYRDGLVVFYTSTGDELLRIPTEKQAINKIALEMQDDQPCLVVSYDIPEVDIYELSLIEQSNGNADKPLKSSQPPTFTISTRSAYLLRVHERRQLQLSAKTSAVATARSSRQLVVAVAQVDGIIDFFALNGTSLRQMQTNASISAIETRRNLLAFSNGTGVIVSSMTRAQGSVFQACPGTSAKISSITFDAVQPEIMYAGSQKGEILVYAVNAGGSAQCRLLSRFTIKTRPRDLTPLALVTIKTYVIAAGPQDIAIFNVSKTQRNGISLSRVCALRLGNPTDLADNVERRTKHNTLVMSFSDGTMGSHLAFITAGVVGQDNRQSTMIIFQSLLPDELDTSEFPWTVFLYAGVVILAVAGSQLFYRWQRQTSVNPWDSIGKPHDSTFGKYGGFKGHEHSPDFDGEDFGRYNSLSDELRRKIAQAKQGPTRRPVDDEADY